MLSIEMIHYFSQAKVMFSFRFEKKAFGMPASMLSRVLANRNIFIFLQFFIKDKSFDHEINDRFR